MEYIKSPKKVPVDDKPKDECGIFGIYGPGLDVSRLTYYGLYALQHRGQESAGIAVSDGRVISLHKDMGLVPEVFTGEILRDLVGKMALGHVRYSTTGSSLVLNAQPLVCYYSNGMIALAHNGNLINTGELRSRMAQEGSVFQSTIDSEVIINLIARYGQDSVEEGIKRTMAELKGAYSLVVMTEDKMIGIRDPWGVRPLCLGRLEDAYILASESCALDTVGAELIRDIEPGEIAVISKSGLVSYKIDIPACQGVCIFEFIYLARPDSVIDGFQVNEVRREMGRQLAREYPVDVDIVISVPDSGTAAARGYALERGIPFEEGLMKNRYIGRTFIQPDQEMRDLAVRLKLNPVKNILKDKRVLMVDDSIVRGTTSGKMVRMLRHAGVKEVHMCVSSPPILWPCYYGIDTSDRDELIAANLDIEEIRKYIGADGLHYLSLEGLLKVFGSPENLFCTACFDGDYPIGVPAGGKTGKFCLELGGVKNE
ncbi:MAG: amidophosphoribosyltransferase [Firmicutes bacterium HGW-Firmicutes-14]|jgi:amidophosphoribosyltransferase|nr:MAG: amidophosphoribosyltransferase [Firmicutes bacterium HGW-Firmicutes-14]